MPSYRQREGKGDIEPLSGSLSRTISKRTISSRGSGQEVPTIKTITSDSGWLAKLCASFLSLSLSFSFPRWFWLITDIHNRCGRIAPAKSNIKLYVRPTVKVDESGVQSAGSHCASRSHFAERHNFPVFRLCNRSDQFWGRSPNRPSPWASAKHPFRTGFHLGTIYDRSPEAFLIKPYPSILLNPSIISRRETSFVKCLLSLNLSFTYHFLHHSVVKVEVTKKEKENNLSNQQHLCYI